MSADMIIKFFENYGLIMTVLATSGIVFVGILKALGLFSKLNTKAKKYVYFICSCVTSMISCTIYLCVKDAFVWADWGMTIVCIIGYTVSIYGIYENTGIRTLLKKIFFTPIKNLLKNIPSVLASKSITEEKILLLAKNLGSDVLLQLANEIRKNEVDADCAKSLAVDNPETGKVQDNATEINAEKKGAVQSNEFIKNNFFS